MDYPEATPLAVIPLRSEELSILFDCSLTRSIEHYHATTCQPIVGKMKLLLNRYNVKTIDGIHEVLEYLHNCRFDGRIRICCRYLGVAVR